MLSDVARPLGGAPRTFICSPTPLVEAVANAAVEIGIPPDWIRTERFGPTGATRYRLVPRDKEDVQIVENVQADLNRALMLDGNAAAGVLQRSSPWR